MAMIASGFSDFHYAIEDVIAEGDKVVVRLSEGGVPIRDLLGLSATGKSFHYTSIHIIRIENDKIVEHWHEQDTLSLMQQLGTILAPGEGGE